MDHKTLKNILDKHRKWTLNEDGGERANLRYADLRYANLSSADLRYADLSSANLSSADLRYANLRYANLSYANLRYANLSSANLRFANLSFANLSSANLLEIRDDFFKVLTVAKTEVVGLFDALMRGKIDGTVYEGECACLVGTIANCRKEPPAKLTIDLMPNSSRLSEKWFLGIQPNDTEHVNPIVAVTKQWIEEFAKEQAIELPKFKLISNLEFPGAFV